VTQLHFIPVDLGSPIVHCSVADPHVVIMTADGAVTMFVLKSDSYLGKTHRLALQKPHISTVRHQSSHLPLALFSILYIQLRFTPTFLCFYMTYYRVLTFHSLSPSSSVAIARDLAVRVP